MIEIIHCAVQFTKLLSLLQIHMFTTTGTRQHGKLYCVRHSLTYRYLL